MSNSDTSDHLREMTSQCLLGGLIICVSEFLTLLTQEDSSILPPLKTLLTPWQNNSLVVPELVSWLLQQFLARSALQHVAGDGKQLLQQVCIILLQIYSPLLCLYIYKCVCVCTCMCSFSSSGLVSSSLEYECVEVKRLCTFNKNF